MIRTTVEALSPSPRPEATGWQWLVNRKLIPGARGMLSVQTLPRGAAVPAHRVPSAESVSFVLSGRADWHAGGQVWPLLPGEGVFNPPGTRRAFHTPRDEGAVLLMVYGGTANPRDAARQTANGVTECGCRIQHLADRGNSPLGSAGGFIDMGVHWLATSQTVGTRAVVVATSTFTPGGSHQLHRHPHADEFFLVLEGGGEHLTRRGSLRLNAGDLAYIPAGEWHGFRTDPGVTTRTVYGYLGAGCLAQAGYELLEEAR